MKFGLFYEHQLPRPWNEGDEQRLLMEALEQVEHGDRLGFDYVWEVEHHFLEEYSHSSAPEVFLAAASQRTKNIRLGHGVVLMAPAYNHPARVAERIATLDLISGGRVEWGTGESASAAELAGFGVPFNEKREMWREATEQAANMLAMDPYPGYHGRYFQMPCRNLVPKPAQRPHPPIWVACSRRETIHMAARCGIGALTFAFVAPEEAAKWAREYYEIIESDACTPIGHAVNANIAMVSGFFCHDSRDEAIARGLDGFRFFGFALSHHYVHGAHRPGRTSIWADFEKARDSLPGAEERRGIGTPDELIRHLSGFAEAGVDQVIFVQQGGRNRHDHILETLDLFARKVMPRFHDGEEKREKRKAERLAPAIERALARKRRMPALADSEIPVIEALGRSVAEPPRPNDLTRW